jgi:CelD/BcsL family acetyltransferase involved in cellulose biosynthesis
VTTVPIDLTGHPMARADVAVSAGTGGAPRAGGAVAVRVLEAEAEFASLEGAWERLQAGAAVTSVFATFEWQYLWWKAYGGGRPLRLLVATSDGEVVGILPLYVGTERVARWPVRLLRFVGTGGDTSPDDLGPVLAAGREVEIARALAAAVLSLRGWDVLDLQDMEPGSGFAVEMARAARRGRLPCRTGRAERIAYVALPESWDRWLMSLHRDRRYRVKKMRRDLLAAHPDARFFAWTDAATLDVGVDRLIELHHKRWEGTGRPHGFSSTEYVGFHRAVMAACLERGRLRLFCLELGGEIAAILYMYRFRDAIYLMQTGFDPEHAQLKPGLVLLGWVIEQAIQEGLRAVDFLKGEHRYKDELASDERETTYLTALRMTPGAAVFGVRRLLLPALKARGARALGLGRPAQGQPSSVAV